MQIKTLYLILILSCLIGVHSILAGTNELDKLRNKVIRLERENKILKESWDSCLEEYEKLMLRG